MRTVFLGLALLAVGCGRTTAGPDLDALALEAGQEVAQDGPVGADELASTDDGTSSPAEAEQKADLGTGDVLPEALDAAPQDVSPDESPDATPEVPDCILSSDWHVTVVAGLQGFKARVAVAVGPDGVPQFAYNVATSADGWEKPDVWHGELRGGSFQHRMVAPAKGVSQEFPTIVVDSKNRAHVFWNRYAQGSVDVLTASPRQDGAVPESSMVAATSDRDEYGPVASIGPDDTIHVLFQERMGPPGAYQYSVGHVVMKPDNSMEYHQVADSTAPFALSPSYAVVAGPGGTAHGVYTTPGDYDLNSVLWYRHFDGASWGEPVRLTDTKLDAWGPGMAVGLDGSVDVVFTLGPDWDNRTLHHVRLIGGVVKIDQELTASVADRSYYLGTASGFFGTTDVAFTRFIGKNADVFHLLIRADGVACPEERLSETPEGDEFATAMAVRPDGERLVAFVESLSTAPHGRVYLARTRESEVGAIVGKVLADAGVSVNAVDIPSEEVEGQSSETRGIVSFEEALVAAVHSFLYDDKDEESPLALVAGLEDGPCLEPELVERVRCFMSQPGSVLALVRRDGSPQAAEHGEQVEDAWIFWLYLPTLSDHGHWAIVDRAGKVPVYNYGFN